MAGLRGKEWADNWGKGRGERGRRYPPARGGLAGWLGGWLAEKEERGCKQGEEGQGGGTWGVRKEGWGKVMASRR